MLISHNLPFIDKLRKGSWWKHKMEERYFVIVRCIRVARKQSQKEKRKKKRWDERKKGRRRRRKETPAAVDMLTQNNSITTCSPHRRAHKLRREWTNGKDYIKWKREKKFLWRNLSPLYPSGQSMLCIWLSLSLSPSLSWKLFHCISRNTPGLWLE